MTKENILITGGAGYLGSVMTGKLLEEGCRVTCLDNLMFNQKGLINYVHNSDFEFIYGDVRDSKLIKKLVTRADAIIPLAGLVGMPLCKRYPNDAMAVNKDAIHALNEMRSNGQKFIYPNTNSGYGTQTGETFCTEETPLEPISDYGKTKCQTENYLLNESNKDAVTFRLATVFGVSPRMRTDLLVNDFVKRAMTDKSLVLFEKDFKRNYIHVRDVADAFSFALDNYDTMKNQPFNLGLDEANLSKLELAEKIKEHIPDLTILDAPMAEDPDKRDYIVSNEKLMNAGFKAKRSLDEGIIELKKAYNILFRDNPYGNV